MHSFTAPQYLLRAMRPAIAALFTLSLLGTTPARAESACGIVHAAYSKMLQAHPKQATTNSGTVNVTAAFGAITETGDFDDTCVYLRDETLNGTAVTVYSETMSSKAGSAVGTLWIDKATGRVLRQDVNADMGAKGKGQQSIRFDYGGKS